VEAAQLIADERGIALHQVLNMNAIRDLSRQMPMTEKEMYNVQHVTKANFGIFGKRFLDILIPYAAQRAVNGEEESMPEEQEEVGSSYGSRTSWDDLGYEAGQSSSGTKRKSGGSFRRGSKRFKSSSSQRKKKTPVKKRAAGGSQRAARGKGGSAGNLLPRPVPQF
jgi:bloom syndrome protein